VSPKASSFYNCDICQHSYDIKDVDENGNVVHDRQDGCGAYKPKSIAKFTAFILSDVVIVALVWQVLVFICTGFFALLDFDYYLRDKLFGADFNVFVSTYICGFVLFFFFLGLLGIFLMACVGLNYCINGTLFGNCFSANDYYTYENYPYYGRYRYNPYLDVSDMCFWYCFWTSLYGRPNVGCCFLCLDCCSAPAHVGHAGSDMDCCSGGCGGGGDMDCKGDGALYIIVIIVLVIAVIGVVFGFILLGILGWRIFNRRIKVLQRKEVAKTQQIQNYWPLEVHH